MLTQKLLAQFLIADTLVGKRHWYPSGAVQKKKILLKNAETQIDNHIITLSYNKNAIFFDGNRLRVPKMLSQDLLSIVKLKIAKNLKKHVAFN